ncbi:MAG: aldehyde dehydrogenase family protein, partial [Propionibacteriaceae bacterium]
MSTYSTINPATGEKLAEFEVVDDATMDGLISSSAVAYASWRSTALEARTDTLRRVADLHLERLDDLAALLTLEMGKPVVQAEGEVKLVASIYRYYADNAAKFLADEELDIVGGGTAVVRTEAIGPLLGIMPWNFPYYQAARFIAPNLALGNTIIVKHARNCPQSALAIESVLRDAGVPDGAYLNAFLTTDQVAAVIADPRVQGVSLTGSERAGSAVGEVARRHMKRYVLELGGSDPFIVLDDADIDEAVAAGVANRVSNGGQTCTASKRFIVVDSVYEEFTKKFVDALTSIEPADPTLRETNLGPLATVGAADDLDEIVQDAVERGARLHVAPGAARQ